MMYIILLLYIDMLLWCWIVYNIGNIYIVHFNIWHFWLKGTESVTNQKGGFFFRLDSSNRTTRWAGTTAWRGKVSNKIHYHYRRSWTLSHSKECSENVNCMGTIDVTLTKQGVQTVHCDCWTKASCYCLVPHTHCNGS